MSPLTSSNKLPNSAKELRELYNEGCSATTWRVWITPLIKKKIIKKHTKKYNPKQLKAIVELLGNP